MQAAVDRRTVAGTVISLEEAVTTEQAHALMTGDLRRPGRPHCGIETGAPADFCLLPEPWAALRMRLVDARPQRAFKTVGWNSRNGGVFHQSQSAVLACYVFI